MCTCAVYRYILWPNYLNYYDPSIYCLVTYSLVSILIFICRIHSGWGTKKLQYLLINIWENGTYTMGLLPATPKLRVAHASRMPGTFSLPSRVSDPDMHQGTCVTHVPWCMLGSLTRGSLWSRWREKHSWHSRCMNRPQFCVSGKKGPMAKQCEFEKELIVEILWELLVL